MSDAQRPPLPPLAQALGKLPSGLFILTVRSGERSTGMLASWVQQAGFEPPMITVAVSKARYLSDWIEETGKFTLNQLGEGNKSLIRHFGRGFAPDSPAFENLGLLAPETARGGPVLEECLAWFDVEVRSRVMAGDHWIVVGEVAGSGLLVAEGEPMVHLRANGLRY